MEKMEKIKILPDSPDPNDETAHLRPIIQFLKANENETDERDNFESSKGGYSEYKMKKKIDKELILNHFELPSSIYFGPDGVLYDKRNGLIISF